MKTTLTLTDAIRSACAAYRAACDANYEDIMAEADATHAAWWDLRDLCGPSYVSFDLASMALKLYEREIRYGRRTA